MFERFTRSARDVVEGAVGHSERAGADSVAEEHILLALLDLEGARSTRVLAALGVAGRRESVERALAEARRRGGVSQAEADALAELGIDVAEIVSRVEESHGTGALAKPRRPRRWWSGHRPFAPAAKDVLAASLRIAVGRGDRYVGDEHMLLALTARRGVPAEVLSEHGAPHAAVARVLSETKTG